MGFGGLFFLGGSSRIKADLLNWLKNPDIFMASAGPAPVVAFGSAGAVELTGSSTVSLDPCWNLRFHGTQAVKLRSAGGIEIAGSDLYIRLLQDPDMSHRCTTTELEVNRGIHSWASVANGVFSDADLQRHGELFDSARIELREDSSAATVVFSPSGESTGQLRINVAKSLVDAGGVPVNSALRDPLYAVTMEPEPQSLLLANLADDFEVHGEGFSARLGNSIDVPAVQVAATGSQITCRAAYAEVRSLAMPDLEGVIATLSAGNALFPLWQNEIPDGITPTWPESAKHSLGIFHRDRARICLDDIILSLLRPRDLLALNVRFKNLSLASHNGKMYLVRSQAGDASLGSIAGKSDACSADELQSYLAFEFPPQSIAEQAFLEENPADGKPCGDVSSEPPRQPAKTILSNGSCLVFCIPQEQFKGHGLPFTLESLLDWKHFRPSLHPNALPPNDERPGAGSACVAQPPAAATAPDLLHTRIEFPYRLLLSPHWRGGWLHTIKVEEPIEEDGRVNSRAELWHTSLATTRLSNDPNVGVTIDPVDTQLRTVRAIWSRDFNGASTKPETFSCNPNPSSPLPLRLAMNSSDRVEIVKLSSDYAMTTIGADGNTLIHQALEAAIKYEGESGIPILRTLANRPTPLESIHQILEQVALVNHNATQSGKGKGALSSESDPHIERFKLWVTRGLAGRDVNNQPYPEPDHIKAKVRAAERNIYRLSARPYSNLQGLVFWQIQHSFDPNSVLPLTPRPGEIAFAQDLQNSLLQAAVFHGRSSPPPRCTIEIQSARRTGGNLMTVVTKEPHQRTTGDLVLISGIPAVNANGTFVCTAVDFLTLRYTSPGANGDFGSNGTVARGIPTYDWAQKIALLGNYPNLLRLLGLVIDFSISSPPSSPGDIRIVPTHPTSGTRSSATRFTADFRPQAAEHPVLKHGALDIASGYSLIDMDVDGAALKTLQAADSSARSAAKFASSRTPKLRNDATNALPAVRSAGIALVRNDNAAMTLDKYNTDVTRRHAVEAGNETDPLFADDLVRGYIPEIRIVADSESCGAKRTTPWFCLTLRNESYKRVVTPKVRLLTNGGGTQVAQFQSTPSILRWAAMTTNDAPGGQPVDPDLHVHEVLFRWRGWSLGVPMPFKSLAEPECAAETGSTNSLPIKLETDVPDASLLPLRFGKTYELRIRTMDMACNISDKRDDLPSLSHKFLRHEPVAAPSILLEAPLTEKISPGEGVELLLLRDDTNEQEEAAPDPIRTIVPPRVNLEMTEMLGMFDNGATPFSVGSFDAVELDIKTAIGPDGKCDVNCDFPSDESGNALYRRPTTMPPPGTYYPDPLAEYLVTEIEDTMSGGKILRGFDPMPFYGDEDWPKAVRYQIGLQDSDDVTWGVQTFRYPRTGPYINLGDEVVQRLAVGLPPGWKVVMSVSSGIDPRKRCLFPSDRLLEDAKPLFMETVLSSFGTSVRERIFENLVNTIKSRLQRYAVDLFTPSRKITLIHAVVKPLQPPAITHLCAKRRLADSSAELTLNLTADRKSTGRIDIKAAWDEWDDTLKDGPKKRKMSAGMDAEDPTVAVNGSTFLLSGTSGSSSGGVAVYDGFVPGGTANAFVGFQFSVTGFINSSNNGPSFKCTASTSNSLTLLNANAVAERRSATAAIVWVPSREPFTAVSEELFGDTEDPQQRVAIENPIAKIVPNPTSPLDHRFHQVFADTAHRFVTYAAVGTSRFQHFYADQSDPQRFQVRGTRDDEVQQIHIRSSSRPPAPDVAYIIPLFTWEQKKMPHHGISSKRHGGGLRIYLRRPWFKSGASERLGIVLWGERAIGQQVAPTEDMNSCSALSKEDFESDAGDDTLRQYVTRWGADPTLSDSVRILAPTSTTFTQENLLVDGETFSAGEAVHGLSLEELEPDLTRPGITPRPAMKDPVTVVTYDPRYDSAKRLWYCDVSLNSVPAYSCFIRLALVRYQPYSLRHTECSHVAVATFAQLLADRSVMVDRKDKTTLLVRLAWYLRSHF